jgi:hypothetical protein
LITMTIHKKESEENVVFDILQFSFKSWIICKSTIISIKFCIVYIEYFFINKNTMQRNWKHNFELLKPPNEIVIHCGRRLITKAKGTN